MGCLGQTVKRRERRSRPSPFMAQLVVVVDA